MEEHQKQTVLDLPKVIAVGIASPVATLLTSRFGIAGTLIGLAVGAVIITVMVDVLKVYLARASHTAVAKVPSSFRAVALPFRPNIRSRLKAAFYWFSSLYPRGRRSILMGSVLATGISFLLGLGVVTVLELGAGKSLSCWVWKECSVPYTSANGDAKTLDMSTVPSIFGGGPSASRSGDALEVRPLDPQQQATPPSGAPESSGATKPPSSSQFPSSETSQGLDSSGAGDQREDQYPPQEEKVQQSSSYYYSEAEDQESPSYYYYSEEEYQQRSTPDLTEEAPRLDTESREEQPNEADSD